MNNMMKKCIAYITTAAMLICTLPAAAADEYADKLLGADSGQIEVLSSAAAPAEGETVLISKQEAFSQSDFIHSTAVTSVGAVGGKNSNDNSARVETNKQNTYFDTGTLSIDTSKKYVYEFNILVENNLSRVYFATKSHAALSANINLAVFIPKSWNKVQMIYDPVSGSSNVYVNGSDMGVYDIPEAQVVDVNDNKQGMRIVMEPTKTGNTFNTLAVCIDNIRLYATDSAVRDYSVELDHTDYESYCADNANGIVYIDSNLKTQDKIVSSLKNYYSGGNIAFAQVMKDSVVQNDSNVIANGMSLVVTDSNNVSRSFTTQLWNENVTVAYGSAVKSGKKFSAGTFTAQTLIDDSEAVLALAQYDRDGHLISIVKSDTVVSDKVMASMETVGYDGSVVKVFLWDSTANLMPKAAVDTYTFRSKDINALFIGSEYIKDSASYIRSIAAADGIDIGIGTLTADNASYRNQLDSVATEDYNKFTYNGADYGNMSFDTLVDKQFIWDYIVLQNYIGSYDDMVSSNWTPITSELVAYIREKLPDAKIFVTTPIPHQLGYYYTDGDDKITVDKAVYSEISDYMSVQASNAAGIASVNNNTNVRFADLAALYEYAQGITGYSASYYDAGHSTAAAIGQEPYNAGNGIMSADDEAAGKIALYSDGTHASAAGSYLQSLYLYSKLTGENVTDNTYVPDSSYIAESDNAYTSTGSLKYSFNPISADVAADLKLIVAGFDVYGSNDVYLTPKSDGFEPKAEDSIIMDEKFNEYSGSSLGNGWMISTSSSTAKVVDDTECGGKYLKLKKSSASGTVVARKFFESNGGNARFDMQLRVNNEYGQATFNMYGFNYSEGSNLSSGLTLSGTKLCLTNGLKKLIDLVPGQWYNFSVCYHADGYTYDIYINGKCVYSNAAYSIKIRTFECFEINIPSTGVADIDIDNLRMSHTEPGEFPTINNSSDVLYSNNYDDQLNHMMLVADTCGAIYYMKDGDNGYLWANRTSGDNGSCSTTFSFPTVRDNLTFEFDVMLEDAGGATKLISLQGGITATIYFSGTNMYVLDNANTRPTYKKGITIGEWHHIKLVTHAEKGVFEIYFDGECLTTEAPFQSNGGIPKFDNFRFAITSGQPSSYRMDNVKITRNYDYDPENSTFEGYAPDSDAPNSYDWQNDYVTAPTGTVYEAEDMQLYNYAAFDDESYNGGVGVAVEGGGYGTADFTFEGESGYYAINVGFGESPDIYDSFYDLRQNGNRLDWWTGQYDDNVHHVRNTRSYHYVAKGDKFKLIGKGGLDPSKLDYVEFAPAQEPADFTYGDLIEDDGTHPSLWRTSSWDADEEGGYVRSGKTVYDCRTDANCTLVRNIYPLDTSFVFDYTKYVNNSTDSVVKIGDGTTFPVWYKFSNRAITVGGTSYSNAYSNYSSVLYRIAVNANAKTYTLLVNGNVLAADVPFDGSIDKFTQIVFETSDSGTARFAVSNVKLSAGYNLFDTFRAYPTGKVPYDWDISYSEPTVDSETGEVTAAAQPLAASASMRSEGNDAQSLRIATGGSAKKNFEQISGKITYEAYFILPEAKDGAYMQLGLGDDYIGFYTKSGDIYYDTDKGFDRPLWKDYKSNIWYTLRIELDTETGKASFFVNDFQKAENIAIKLTAVDNVKFSSGDNDGYLWVDDVTVVNSIYETTVPEPQVPQLRDDYTIVMECCDLWREGNHFGNYSYSPFDNRIPLLGYLEDGNVEVADWENKFMLEHGITTYVPCWYTNTNYSNSPVKDPRNSAKLHAFLKSDYCEQLDFAILITVVSGSGGIDGFINNYVNYWVERYFKAPNYWKIGNKPVIPVYDVNSVYNISGGNNAELFRRIDEVLVDNGFDGGIYIGTHGGNTTVENGYDYKYKYHMGTTPVGTTVISSLLNEQSSDGVGYIASPSQGWGNEAWGRADRKYNIPLDNWNGSLEWIRDHYFPSQDSESLTSKTLWLGNWNEYSEGHSLAPTRIAGFGYLDGVRKIFTNGATDHYDQLPDKAYDQMTAIMWK